MRTLKSEGDSNDGYCEKSQFLLGNISHYVGSTGTGTTSHACCDEYHLGIAVVEGFSNLIRTLLSCLAGDLWRITGPKASCYILPEYDFVRDLIVVELLYIGIEDKIAYAFYPL